MEQLVRVRQTHDDGTAAVIHIRESACSGDCHKCSGCGAAKETVIFTADNPIGAVPGDLVMKAAVVLYVLPLVLFFLGYWLGTLPGSFGALGGGIGFVLGVVIVIAYDRLVVNKADLHYTITAFADTTTVRKEEENHG